MRQNRHEPLNPCFPVYCPRCGYGFPQVSIRRLKLKLVGVADEDELNKGIQLLSEHLIIEGFDDVKKEDEKVDNI